MQKRISVSEVSVHGQLAPLHLGCDKTEPSWQKRHGKKQLLTSWQPGNKTLSFLHCFVLFCFAFLLEQVEHTGKYSNS
jgi:hypothetical protein